MEFKKCLRCGGFHLGEFDTCNSCHAKELEEAKILDAQFKGLKNVSLEDVAHASELTGISGPRIERYLDTYFKI